MNAGIRFAAAAALTAACAAAGWAAASRQTRRARALAELSRAVGRLEAAMLEKRLPLAEALAAAEHALFREAARELGALGPADSLVGAARRLSAPGRELDALSGADMAALRRLAEGLGRGGEGRQRLLLREAADELRALAAGSEKQAAERGRLYVSLGALGGLALAVLLM